MARFRTAATVAAVAAAVAMVSACGDSKPTTREAASAETATAVCGMLRGWNNEIADSINGTSDAITDADDPATAPRMLRAGFDDLIQIAEDHQAEVDELELPVSNERDRLLEELHSGAGEAVAAFEEERADIEDLAQIEVSEQRGVLGTAFIAAERAGAVVEPAIGTYEDEDLKAAFAADDGCEHVIQPF